VSDSSLTNMSESAAQGAHGHPDVETFILVDDHVFPNNGRLPLLVYRGVLGQGPPELSSYAHALFAENHWTGSWIDGIYDFDHYHSTAHEVLAICRGRACVRFGGERGIVAEVSAGDVVVIPAGVAHQRLSSSGDLVVVGAYPKGQHYDMCYGEAGERPAADDRIARVALPEADPVHGPHGPLMKLWGR
jgi:uncharacterized protein YjlB